MKADQFLAQVAEVNSTQLSERPDDFRLAVNAILTLDAFFGHYYEDHTAEEEKKYNGDIEYRNLVAQKSKCYELLRDSAAAIKHGQLRGKRPRLVRGKDEFIEDDNHWNDDGIWQDDDKWTDTAIYVVSGSNLDDWARADQLVNEVIHVAKEELKPTGRTHLKLTEIRSVLGLSGKETL